jgi:hypothetical protein
MCQTQSLVIKVDENILLIVNNPISHLFWIKFDVNQLQHYGSQPVKKRTVLFLKRGSNTVINDARIYN